MVKNFWHLLCFGVVFTGSCKHEGNTPSPSQSNLDGTAANIMGELLPKPAVKPQALIKEFMDALLRLSGDALKAGVGEVSRVSLQKEMISGILKYEGMPRQQLADMLRDLVNDGAGRCGGASCAKVFGLNDIQIEDFIDKTYEAVRVDAKLLADSALKKDRDTLLATLQSHRSYMELLYWDNRNLGFGHVALEAYGPDAKAADQPDAYLSWAMGNDLETDLDKHGKLPQRYTLPLMGAENYYAFKSWFDKSAYGKTQKMDYGDNYCLLTDNCAHAVLAGMRAFGYQIPLSNLPALRPNQIRKATQEYIQDNLTPEKAAELQKRWDASWFGG